jgi:4-amino-4-deoxy-L-arabinose transferase-like glycosyltransferase
MIQGDKKDPQSDRSRLGDPAGDPATDQAKPVARGKEINSPFVAPVWRRQDTVFLFLIVLVAALFRLLNLDYMEFKGDEAGNLFLASALVSGQSFPLVGIMSSIASYTPPFFVYLMAIPVLFSRNPLIAAGFVALLNCAAVGLTYVFCRRYFGQIAAIIAAVFFAVNPWAVFYSRKIWQQDVLPLFVVGFFFSLLAVVCEGRKKHLLSCFACLAAATQLHLSSVYFLVVLLVVAAAFRPKAGWRIWLGGIGIFLVSYAPYVVYDLLHQGYDTKIYLHAFSAHSHIHPEALLTPLALGSTLGFMHFADWPALDLLQLLLFVAGVVYLFFRLRDPKYATLLLWYLVPTAFLLISKLVLYPHYFICFFPIQFVVVGVVVSAVIQDMKPRDRALKYATAALMVVLAGYQMLSSVRFVTAIAEPGPLAWSWYGADYGPPFRVRVQEIRELAQRGIVDPATVQKELLQGKPPDAEINYNVTATEYLVENLNSIP